MLNECRDRPPVDSVHKLGLGQDFRVGVCGVWLCVLSMEGACGAAEEAGPATAAARLGWTQLRQQLWELGAVFRKRKHVPLVSEPCVGLSPFKTWVEQSFEPLPGDLHRHPVVNCYDTDSGLLGHWKDFPGAHIGPGHSITDVPLDKLEDSEGLVAGPPCQPFSPAGQRHGTSDARSVPFESCVDWVVELGTRGCLVWFLLENSNTFQGHPYCDEVIDHLKCCLPWFYLDVRVEDSVDWGPMRRRRTFIRGLRLDCLPRGFHGPLPVVEVNQLGHGKPVTLESLLQKGLPPTDPSMLSVGMQRNLRRYKDMASQSEEQGRLRVACAELDRDPKNVYGPRVEFDKTSSLRTSGPALFLLSLDDLQQSWDRQELHRMLSIPERFLLMGHPAETATAFESRAAAKRASGNGMHTLVMACLVAPMLLLADQAGVAPEGRPTPAATMEQLWDMAYEDLRATGSMGRVHRKQKVCSPRSRPTAAKRNVLRKSHSCHRRAHP